MPKSFFSSKHWKEALLNTCLSNNTTALLAVAQRANLIAPHKQYLPLALGGLVSIASEAAHNGLEFSPQAQILAILNFSLNFFLPEYLVEDFDIDINLASACNAATLATISLFLAVLIIFKAKPEPLPEENVQPTPLDKKKFKPKVEKNSSKQQSQPIQATEPKEISPKEVILSKQIKLEIEKKFELLNTKSDGVLQKIRLSCDYLQSPNCKVDKRKRDSLLKSNEAKKSFIDTELNIQKEKIIQFNLSNLPTSESELKEYLSQGQTLLTNLLESILKLQTLDSELDKQLQFEQKSIKAWNKKHHKLSQQSDSLSTTFRRN